MAFVADQNEQITMGAEKFFGIRPVVSRVLHALHDLWKGLSEPSDQAN